MIDGEELSREIVDVAGERRRRSTHQGNSEAVLLLCDGSFQALTSPLSKISSASSWPWDMTFRART